MRFVLQVDIRIKAGEVAAFMAKLAENGAAARAEPGCLQFDILVDPQDVTRVMLYEVYADEEAFQAHQQTAAFKKYLAEAVPLLESRQRHVWKRIE
jgi:autoinducer 2-degrading protein